MHPTSSNGGNSSSFSNALIFGDLEQGFLDEIESRSTPLQIEKDQTLFFQKDPGDALYLVKSGSIEICHFGADGKKLALNLMRPSDVFGEIAAVDGGERTATATALEHSTLAKVSSSQIQGLIRENSELALELIQILCRRLRWISDQVEERALADLESRLAVKLLLLSDRFADASGVLKMSQSDLADFLGVSREAVNKVLQVWRKDGLISLRRGEIQLVDRKKLEVFFNPID